MIHEFHVQNYKALRDVKLKLTPMHVLIGPNDSGKTSILEALGALCRSVEMPLEQAFQGRWEGRELVSHGATSTDVSMAARISDDIGEFEYSIRCGFSTEQRHAYALQETIDQTSKWPGRVGMQAKSAVAMYSVEPDSAKGVHIDHARRVKSSIQGVQAYRLNPRDLALPVAPDASRRFRLERSGFGLAQLLDDLKDYSARKFVELDDRFARLFPSISEISLERTTAALKARWDDKSIDYTLAHGEGKGVYFRSRQSGVKIPSSQVSDGMLYVAAYLGILSIPNPPKLLLLEEPENGIHPLLLKEVTSILRELLGEDSHTQVVMATHSPYMVDLFQADEITLCYKDNAGEVKTRCFAESPIVRKQMGFFTMGEIWTAEEEVIKAESTTEESVAEAST